MRMEPRRVQVLSLGLSFPPGARGSQSESGQNFLGSCQVAVKPPCCDEAFPPFCSACGRELDLHVGRRSPWSRAWQPRRFEDRP